MKRCINCKLEKPTSEFYSHIWMADGHLSSCKDCKRKYSSKYYANNKDKVKEYQATPEVKERRAKIKKQWDIKNKELNTKKMKSESRRLLRSQNRKERYKNDIEYRNLVLLRGRIYRASSGICCSKKTMELMGCSIGEFISHIESLFRQGMNWNNQGEWEIDHIKSCVSFDLTDPVQQRECFNYTNLQPLWAEDNLKKSKLELF